ncbi:MAG: bifunctional 4-hydroxy-2-oxoglutarate aldolase/2-dehydro-3-deoxy-phosphogluconate aldolase [Brasilonema octagenarum HA4186-MV1]|jgi:2-dehydro-3-deoxyphosphogluconate aldolase/(4S)-4-hydroxy-2-oxoglutarate aldolase|uniref:Keto-deoxy-phosphogluconate aldolase n=2 Tax=Brasilonema TaxID=383614 RepID=A0A856MNX3_9CYAN|nr:MULTISPECIES: bifunctional 4-hydroxy-2-oxoglutarate aldolase/2-dehydro-3-deoxy-phosphogluconate aldolase [Brasilonema]MBW4629334.1 bifunctional 4-hydroxy-2-oxoglutarate aldolase/2-dehydro-3-deoxy-phosphogluconate aldolase [Brasilonema octagenarum HA4186-MV1]NMF64171.1 keto-deoxy-phosphogluconate aldolase [Brasilonema octagenarum UFV-OR1]QDL11790.1 keto-deoxy-phosphogluconate aldolase [Brasilonema sennae CENA114]QDL18171.1 keto-deoxy-phosphogluconate aldolase [Brasilonema octagenarum UFV-E1]
MSGQAWLSQLKQHKVIAVVRAPKVSLTRQMALAVASGGIQLIEITWNSAGATELIAQLKIELPNCTIGTGTLLNLEQMQEAIAAGAQFLFTPHVDPKMIQAAVDIGVTIIPGALSPTEIVTAWSCGATCVKVFPTEAMGGVSYIRSLRGPLGHIPLIPTGGVTLENAKEFLEAGAIAVGLSSQLFPKEFVDTQNWEAITSKAASLMQKIS